MCVICGCSNSGLLSQTKPTEIEKNSVAKGSGPIHYKAVLAPDEGQSHAHQHGHRHEHHDHSGHQDLHYGAGTAKVSVPGMSQARAIQIEQNVLGANQNFAEQNRQHFGHLNILALNLVSSPGSGKTTLLCQTILEFRQKYPDREINVIEGDQQTTHDADRIRATGSPAIQVNTGKGCHLDAQMVGDAFRHLPLNTHVHQDDHHATHQGGILFIENVGNLVCPAMWDLGEAAKVAILSVTEGEDKPLKYPDMFAAASLMIINKIDLLPYVSFDLEKCKEFARRVNPDIQIFELSATSGQGMSNWIDWLQQESRLAHILKQAG